MSRSKRSSAAAPVYAAIPYVSLASPRGCDRVAPGHQCHSIQASQALQIARGDNRYVVALGQPKAVTIAGVEVTQLAVYNHGGLVANLLNHDPELAGRIITGGREFYVWEPSFGVLFALTDAQREGLDAGAITLVPEADFTSCRARSDQ